MSANNYLLPEGDLLPEGPTAIEDGTLDSLGIKYQGPILEGLVKGMDASLRLTTRANPLDPFNVEDETWNTK